MLRYLEQKEENLDTFHEDSITEQCSTSPNPI